MDTINKSRGLTRRGFLLGAAATGAVASMGALAGCASGEEKKSEPAESSNWDASYDAVVVGAGFAGLATAITAAGAGASVVVIDSAPEEYAGGNSRVCGQLVWSPEDTKVAKDYFLEINHGYTDDIPDDMLNAFVEEVSQNKTWIEDEVGVPMKQRAYLEYPAAANIAAAEGCFCPEAGMLGAQLWEPMLEYALDLGIEVLYEHEAVELILDSDSSVAGVLVTTSEGEKRIQGNKGVALCCGGFENNAVMKSNYLKSPGRPIGTPYNTGNGIKMSQAIGADLWHMHTAMSPYAFDYLDYNAPGFEDNAISVSNNAAGGAIWLDKYGKRFMDEGRDSQHGLGYEAVLYEDSNKLETPRIPLWVVTDDTDIQTAGLFSTTSYINFHGGWKPSAGCVDEIEKGWVIKADTVEELASKMEVDAATLAETFERYNAFAAAGADEDFGRSAEKMRVLEPPFYAVSAHPALLNTDGGPRRDADGHVVHVSGEPIAKLYSAGELGSIWAHHYQGSGNVGECLAFGRIVGRNIAAS